jgi:O-acetyl-ADP-ribose deacetylase (regulator of RNase III)
VRELTIGTCSVELLRGDITQQATGAIVNAANSTLLGGGGVDGAIHRTGGPAILEECQSLGGCDTGDAKVTTAGRLPARYVVHAVGPVYRDGKHGEAELLASAYRRSLIVAADRGVSSIAFPSISTGAYRFPIAEAARIALTAVAETVQSLPVIETVRFVLFSEGDLQVYERTLSELAATWEQG